MVKDINIKHKSYYIFNDMIDLKNFDEKFTEIEQNILQAHWYFILFNQYHDY